MDIWQQLANGVAGVPSSAAAKRAAAPKRKVTPRPAATPSYSPAYINSLPTGGGSSANIPMLPGSTGGGVATAAPTRSAASLLAELKRQAQSTVAMELDPQIRARQFARQESTRDYRTSVAELQKRLGLTKTELTQLFGSADVLLRDNAQKTGAALDVGKGKAAAAYDQLQQMVGQTYGQAGQDVSAELARLGQGGGDVQGRLAADQAFTTGQVGAQKAAATSTIDAIKAASTSEGAQLRGSTAAAAPMMMGRAQLAADDKQTELSTAWQSTMRQLDFQIRELTGSRKAKESAVLNELKGAQAQAEQDAQQLNFLNQIKAAELGISQGQLDLAKTRLGVDVQNQQNNLVLKAKELQARLGEQAAKANQPKTGTERAYSYLGTYKGAVPQAQLQSALEDAINGNSNDPGWYPGGPGTPGYDSKYMDQYKRDISAAVAQRGWSSAEKNALLNAVNYYFNR